MYHKLYFTGGNFAWRSLQGHVTRHGRRPPGVAGRNPWQGGHRTPRGRCYHRLHPVAIRAALGRELWKLKGKRQERDRLRPSASIPLPWRWNVVASVMLRIAGFQGLVMMNSPPEMAAIWRSSCVFLVKLYRGYGGGELRSREQIGLGIWSHTGVTGLRRFLCPCVSEREMCRIWCARSRRRSTIELPRLGLWNRKIEQCGRSRGLYYTSSCWWWWCSWWWWWWWQRTCSSSVWMELWVLRLVRGG